MAAHTPFLPHPGGGTAYDEVPRTLLPQRLVNRTGIYCGLCCLVPVIAVIWFLRRAARPDKPDRPGPEPDGRYWQRR